MLVNLLNFKIICHDQQSVINGVATISHLVFPAWLWLRKQYCQVTVQDVLSSKSYQSGLRKEVNSGTFQQLIPCVVQIFMVVSCELNSLILGCGLFLVSGATSLLF